MICETCRSCDTFKGMIVQMKYHDLHGIPLVRYVTCPDCGGSGVAHCCEGERPDMAGAGE